MVFEFGLEANARCTMNVALVKDLPNVRGERDEAQPLRIPLSFSSLTCEFSQTKGPCFSGVESFYGAALDPSCE